MAIRLTVDDKMKIQHVAATMPSTPFPECQPSKDPLQALIGRTVAVCPLEGITLDQFGGRPIVGRLVSGSMIRELGPVLTALMLTGRIGSGMDVPSSSCESSARGAREEGSVPRKAELGS